MTRKIVPAGVSPRWSHTYLRAMSTNAAVQITSLTKRYRGVAAIDDISFTLPVGTVTGFLGPNGAGKTTTLRVLLGLAAADGGTALVGGRRYRELDEPARWVGAVLESNDFHPGRSRKPQR